MPRVSVETYVTINPEMALEVVRIISKAYDDKTHLFANPKVSPPEERAFPLFIDYGKYRGLPDYGLNAVFFIANNLYADNTSKQLKRVSKPQVLEKHEWLLDPNKVANSDPDQVVYGVLDFVQPARYNRVRTAQNWLHNANVLAKYYGGSVNNFFAAHDFDAEKILPILQGPEKKKDWHLFKGFGSKTVRLTLQYIGQYNLAPLKNLDRIGVPVDFLIARIMIQTGALNLVEGEAHKKWVLDRTLVPLFIKMCIDHRIPPQKVSEALWLLGHFGCNLLNHDQCPVAHLCTTLIPRDPIDEDGKFVLPKPEDDFRWKGKPKRIDSK